jgi:DNA-binding transcriptional ArsR family regulator
VSEPQRSPANAVGPDERLIKAISHPLRYRLLVLFNERTASPKELAEELDQPLGRVSHHVRELARIGAIELVRTEPRRGAVEHYYRAAERAWFSDEHWSTLPLTLRRGLVGETLTRIVGDLTAAAASGGFDPPSTHMSFTLLELDADAKESMATLLRKTLERALELQRESRERQRGNGGEETASELVMLHFERGDEG